MAKDAENGDKGSGPDGDALWRAIEEALIPYRDIYGLVFVAEVRHILWCSHRKRRIARRLRAQPQLDPAGYVALVVDNYRFKEKQYCDLFIMRDEQAWELFTSKLLAYTFKFLCGFGLPPFLAAEYTPDYTQAAILCIWETPFPFDVAFDAWATITLHNVIRKGARGAHRANQNGDARSLDDLLGAYVPDPHTRDLDYELRMERVQWAISQLPLQYTEFVNLRYMDGLSYEEIATLLNCEVNVLYDRNKNAKKLLRQIFKANGII